MSNSDLSLRSKVIKLASKLPLVNTLLEQYRLSLRQFPAADRKGWLERIQLVMDSPDLKHIPKVADAGKIKDGYLIMHNGLKIEPLSYYGYPMLKMFKKSGGIHEPQEERIFVEALKKIPASGVMVELGSYWAFYSMCFQKAITGAKNYLVEPTDFGLDYGKKNFQINNMRGDFTRAYVGNKPGNAPDGVKIINIDEYLKEKGISFVDMLHADIQGFELEMLEGASDLLTKQKAGFIFISTHSNELHNQCVSLISKYGYRVIQSINLDETYSFDGLIVAVSPTYTEMENIQLSKRK